MPQQQQPEQGNTYQQSMGLAFLFSMMTMPARRVYRGERFTGLRESIAGYVTGAFWLSYGCPKLLTAYSLVYWAGEALNYGLNRRARARGNRTSSLSWGKPIFTSWCTKSRRSAQRADALLLVAVGLTLVFVWQHNLGAFLMWSGFADLAIQANSDAHRERVLRDMEDAESFQQGMMDELQQRRGTW